MLRVTKAVTLVLVIAALCAFFAFSAAADDGELSYGAATVNATSLNLRSGPSTDYERITLIMKNQRLVILDKGDGKWYHVNYEGKVGYVDADYLKDVNTVENFNASGEITATSVRLREKPNTDSNVLASLDSGNKVSVIGINEGWYKVKVSGKTGYVRSDLMKITGESTEVITEYIPADQSEGSELGRKIVKLALQFEGYDYVYGEESPEKGFDCSGLVWYCFKQYGYDLERRASLQYKNNGTTVSKSNLQPGDLVFFSSNHTSVTHVGIYIGDDQFIHASTSNTGVIISNLTSSYYTQNWWGAKRIG
ncbi:MAG: SH3 domain-containing protein [Oscillospiraceae bacterium]|nr:SH3 domain-containing protein [Oscillospiraceae bacterium]